MTIEVAADTYFREMYLDDWTRFSGGDRLVHGPRGLLCGMTMVALLANDRINQYHSPEHFLCVQYELNLLNQSLYTYFPRIHRAWEFVSAPFADCRCSSHHGGVSTPESIFHYAEHPTGYDNLVPVTVPDCLKSEFDQFFVPQYLPSLPQLKSFIDCRVLSPRDLLSSILSDSDCTEFRRRHQTRRG